MKKVFLKSLALCLIVSSCNQNDLFNSQMNNEETTTVQVETTTPTMRKAQTELYCAQ